MNLLQLKTETRWKWLLLHPIRCSRCEAAASKATHFFRTCENYRLSVSHLNEQRERSASCRDLHPRGQPSGGGVRVGGILFAMIERSPIPTGWVSTDREMKRRRRVVHTSETSICPSPCCSQGLRSRTTPDTELQIRTTEIITLLISGFPTEKTNKQKTLNFWFLLIYDYWSVGLSGRQGNQPWLRELNPEIWPKFDSWKNKEEQISIGNLMWIKGVRTDQLDSGGVCRFQEKENPLWFCPLQTTWSLCISAAERFKRFVSLSQHLQKSGIWLCGVSKNKAFQMSHFLSVGCCFWSLRS